MRDRHNSRWDILISLVIIAVIGIVVFIFNYLTPLCGDDYAYSCIFGSHGRRVETVSDIFISQYQHYFNTNGRTVTHFLAQLFLLLGRPFFSVFNTLSFLGLGLMIYYHVYLTYRTIKPLSLVFIYFSLFTLIPDFGQSFLWLTGSANYLYGPLITLAYIIPYRKVMVKADTPSLSQNIVMTIVMFFLGLLSGNVNENNGVLAVVISFSFGIAFFIKDKRVLAWNITGAIGTVIGCLFMLLSPGTRSRLGDEGFGVLQIPRRMLSMTADLFEKYGFLLFVLIFLLCVLVVFHKKAEKSSAFGVLVKLKLPLLYFLFFLISFYALAVPPYFDYRVWSTFTVFLIISVLSLFEEFERAFLNGYSLAKRCTACAIILIIIGIAYNNYPELRVIDSQYKQRENIITDAIDNSINEVFLPPISSINKYSCFDAKGDIMKEGSAWQNILMARYYNLDKVYASESKK